MDNKEKSPEKELIESIGLMIEKGMESNTNIYTGVVKSVDGKRAVVAVNGQNQNVSIATADVSSGNVVRVFVPEGNMSAAFIIKAEASGGGEPTTTAYGDLTGKPQINGVTLVDNKTSKELNLYGTGNEPPYPVTSVNGQTGAVVLSAADVGALPNTTVIPDKTSQLDNDSGYITNSALTGYAKKTEIPTKTSELTNDSGYITNVALEPYAKTVDIPTKTSQLNNDSGYITADDIPVKSVDGATGAVVTNAVKTTPQSLTDAQKQQARTNIGAGTSSFDGNYNSLTNKPTIPTKTSQLTNDSGFITNAALTGYAKTTDIPTKTSQLDNDSHYITASEAPVQSVNTKTGAVVLTQDDVGDGTTYVRTHNDFTNVLKTQINTNKDNIATLDGDVEGLQTDVGTLKTNVSSLQTALTSKQDVIVGAASTITKNNLTTNRALVSNSSGKVAVSNVTSTELGYLDGVTSNIQTQLNKKLEKAPVTSVNNKTGAVQLNASDVGALPNTTVIPSKTSQLDNDSGFITDIPIASATQLGGVKVGAGLSVTANGVLSATGGGTADAVEWNNVLNKPTTIAGYGITDAKIENGTITLGNKTITPLTSAPVTSVNSKTGAVVLKANDVGAISTGNISQTLGTSTTKVPSEKAVSAALSKFGTGDMLKSTYDPTGSVATAGGIPEYVEANGGKIDTIKVNGTAQVISDKTVNIAVPTKTSQLTNDSGFITDKEFADKVSKSGDTMTGKLTVPQVETGDGNSNFFQCRKFRGEGNADTYYHAIDFGYQNHDRVDFHEYGGIWNFFKNTSGKANEGSLCGKITTNGWEGGAKLTGSPTAPTPGTSDNSTRIATTAFVNSFNGTKLESNGDGSNVTAAFTAASSRTNISTGEKLSVLFGKIAKWLSDLGSLAFKSTVAKTDLASDVQTSLGKADSALQSVTKSDVGLGNVDNVKQYSASNPPPYPVTSVNSKTGDVKLTANDVGAVSKTGDTMTGNLTVGSASLQTNGYVTGTWLRTTANTSLGSVASKIAVINDGWVYSRTTAQIKSDIGLGNVDNVKQYSASNPPPYPVTSVNGHTGSITIREVPAVTTSDNGKFLRVVNGAWAAAAIDNASGVSF